MEFHQWLTIRKYPYGPDAGIVFTAEPNTRGESVIIIWNFQRILKVPARSS